MHKKIKDATFQVGQKVRVIDCITRYPHLFGLT